MGSARIDQLEPGMVVRTEVVDRNGRVLLAAGSAITEKHIRVFRMWGVTEVDVGEIGGGDPAGVEEDVPDRLAEEAAARVEELFARANPDHPAMAELMRLATAWHLRVLRAKRSHGTEAA